MLWFCVAVFVFSTSTCVNAETLAEIKWKSDVNTLASLEEVFKNDAIKIIEVDVTYGRYEETPKPETSSTTSRPDSSSTTSTSKPDSSSTTSTAKPSTTSTTVKPTKPDFEPTKAPDDKWPVNSLFLAVDPIAFESEMNFYQVVPEDSLTIDMPEFPLRNGKTAIIDQHKNGQSDLLFTQFLAEAIKHGKAHAGKTIKFNFKDERIVDCIDIIQKIHKEIKFSVWLHADVLQGPNGAGRKIDAENFIYAFNQTENYVLSLGWTTTHVDEPKDGYTAEHTKDMKAAIVEKAHLGSGESLNFPLRAAYAIKSTEVLEKFYNDMKTPYPKFTYTIYSGEADKFDGAAVSAFVKKFGTDKVYLSLSDELRKTVDLSQGKGGASGLIQFGLLNLAALAVVTIFRNGFH